MKRLLIVAVAMTMCTWLGCNKDEPLSKKSASDSNVSTELGEKSAASQIRGITATETVIQGLSEKKSLLAKYFVDRSLETSSIALDEIQLLGPTDEGNVTADATTPWGLAESFNWPIESEPREAKLADVWNQISGKFTDSQFGVLKGVFIDDDHFETETKFEGRVQMSTEPHSAAGVKALQTIGWRRENGEWKIESWKQKKFQFLTSTAELFRDVTEDVFPDPETRDRISLATHEDLIVARCNDVGEVEIEENGRTVKAYSIKEAKDEYKGCNDWGSVGQYPSVSTVDYNGDGFDDLFITDRWQAPQLLKNNGDFTFSDVTTESGIDVTEMATCGYFFDYDNDGDSDLFLGMSMVPSLFFVNESGVFRRHEAINKTLADTRFVNAISVADINRDGLLDLYLSTYSTGTGPIEDWIGFVTRESEQLKTKLKILKADKFVDRGGPPNILLMNRGDNFEWTAIDDTLKQYRCSYQSSWMDYDNDGDDDLYICNDFSPDVFLRNDTAQGSFKVSFSDVTKEVIPTMDMGFGMGCDWGDYDNDGDLDLYVSNMYSKAGNRIVDQIEGTDPRFKVAAHGNFLFQNNGGVFEQVAGDGKDQQHVARVGWSYGGQFADFDNDGGLDLYVPSGCYSAPQEVKTKIDL